MPPLVQVTRDHFYQIIGDFRLDVHPSIRSGPYPYTTDWVLPSGRIIGTTFPAKNRRSNFFQREYWISEEYISQKEN